MPGKKLLVADDSLTIQKVIRLALSNEGYDIQAVADGNDAIQQIALFRPDVVLVDVSLPGQSAFEVKRDVNQHPDLEEIRFVLMSSAFEKVDEEQVQQVKFHGRLTKPFDPAHLRKVLSEALGQIAARRTESTAILERPDALKLAGQPNDEESQYEEEEMSFSHSSPPDDFNLSSSVTKAIEPEPTPSFDFSAPSEMDQWTPDLSAFSKENHSNSPGDQLSKDFLEDWKNGTTLQPEELPPLPALPETPAESTSLWDSEDQESSFLMPEVTPQPLIMDEVKTAQAPVRASNDSDSDIKILTESTMRMTGMDDFQWKVSEPSTRSSTPGFNSQSFQNFSNQLNNNEWVENEGEFEIKNEEDDELPLIPPPASAPIAVQKPEKAAATPPPMSAETLAALKKAANPPAPSVEVAAISAQQIEDLIREEVRKSLKAMTATFLPEMAERIIKEEIHRLLVE
jgi:CheY-like chemotaxis protein